MIIILNELGRGYDNMSHTNECNNRQIGGLFNQIQYSSDHSLLKDNDSSNVQVTTKQKVMMLESELDCSLVLELNHLSL